MHRHGIRAIMAQPRRVRTTDSRHDFPIAPNLLDRNFTAAAPNRIWLADITYIETDQGWLYLAAVMDLCSRRIAGWAMEDHLRAELPLMALRMAISAQRPGAGLIHHSDRGVQYASADYRKVMQSTGPLSMVPVPFCGMLTFCYRATSRLYQTEKNSVRANVFRVTPESGHCSTQSACLKGANFGSGGLIRSPRRLAQAASVAQRGRVASRF